MSDDLPILLDMVNDVLMAAEKQQGEVFSGELRQALNALTMHPEARNAPPQIASRLQYLESPIGVGFLAVWLGAGVENGLDPDQSAIPLLEVFLKWTRTISTTPSESAEPEERADEASANSQTLLGLERMGQGLVAHLSRCPDLVARLTLNTAVLMELDRVSHHSVGALWVLELLRKRSGTLLVLHGSSPCGFLVSYEHLSNCFHLFTLLQGALAGKMPGARRASAEVLAVAKGEAAGEIADSAWWHYGSCKNPEPDLAASVWGEADPAAIPAIDGQQTLLLWPPVIGSRTWDSGFFGPLLPTMPPRVTITGELSPEEIKAWRSRLQLGAASEKPWWKIW